MSLILASSSPRRQELLSHLKIPFKVISADIDESIWVNENPNDYIKRMVQQKAQAVCLQKDIFDGTNSDLTSALVLTADTIGVLPNGRDVLVKPTDKADAFAMWSLMSDNYHYVWTAVQATLINQDAHIIWQKQILETTKVQFIKLHTVDMEKYWETDEPIDKAGGYAIQGRAAAWVSRIEGSYSNVVGLPLAQVKILIEEVSQLSCLSML